MINPTKQHKKEIELKRKNGSRNTTAHQQYPMHTHGRSYDCVRWSGQHWAPGKAHLRLTSLRKQQHCVSVRHADHDWLCVRMNGFDLNGFVYSDSLCS